MRMGADQSPAKPDGLRGAHPPEWLSPVEADDHEGRSGHETQSVVKGKKHAQRSRDLTPTRP